jgi:hypothetical protein
MAGCGGSSGPSGGATTDLAGSYAGTWSESQGGTSEGPATIAVNSVGDVTIQLSYSSGPAPQNITGMVDSRGNFKGQLAELLHPQPISGVLLPTGSGGLNGTLTYILTPGPPAPPQQTWYLTTTRQ